MDQKGRIWPKVTQNWKDTAYNFKVSVILKNSDITPLHTQSPLIIISICQATKWNQGNHELCPSLLFWEITTPWSSQLALFALQSKCAWAKCHTNPFSRTRSKPLMLGGIDFMGHNLAIFWAITFNKSTYLSKTQIWHDRIPWLKTKLFFNIKPDFNNSKIHETF